MLLLCGRATVPPVGGVVSTILTSVAPFAAGALRRRCSGRGAGDSDSDSDSDNRTTKLSALLLLYIECCDLLREAEGSLYVGDVLITLMLVLCWVASSAAACALYARCALLSADDARLVALTAIPKCLDRGWESSTACIGSGLSRLPAVFLAPTQVLLLAAMMSDDDDDRNVCDGDDDDKLVIVKHENYVGS